MFNVTITPDLQTRESVMVAAGRVQLSLVDTDGNTRYIKIEAKRKNASGYGYEKGTVTLAEATHVFVSEKGYGTQRIGTYYPPKPGSRFTTGRMFVDDNLPNGEFNGHVVAFRAAVDYINGQPLPASFVQIEAESQCGLCGHKLEDPASIARGIGPDCAQKPTGTRILHASAFAPSKQSEQDLLREEYDTIQLQIDELARQRDALAARQSQIALRLREIEKAEFAEHEAKQEALAFANDMA